MAGSSMFLIIALVGVGAFFLLKNKGGLGGLSTLGAPSSSVSIPPAVPTSTSSGGLPFGGLNPAGTPAAITTTGVSVLNPNLNKMGLPIVGAPDFAGGASDFGDGAPLDQGICQCDSAQCCYRQSFYQQFGGPKVATSCSVIQFGNTVNACQDAYSHFNTASFQSHVARISNNTPHARALAAQNLQQARMIRRMR
jgi:hypothetical protein